METLIISLPSELKKFLDGEIAKGKFASYSDYMEKNLAHNMKQEEWANSPDDFPIDPKVLKAFRERGEQIPHPVKFRGEQDN